MGIQLNEDDIVLFFAGMAISGCSANIQQSPMQIAKHAVAIAIATRKEFIGNKLLPGVSPSMTLQELTSLAKTGDRGAVDHVTSLVEQMNRAAKDQGVKGIPGDGTFENGS